MKEIQMRGQAYILLSQLLQQPDLELLDVMNRSDFQEVWQQVEKAYDISFPKSWNGEALRDIKEWNRKWNQTMGPMNPLAEPIESLYKVWTKDPSCEITIANQKGFLKGDWACHMEDLLVKSGFEIPTQFAHCPDHLVLELEFASLLVEEASYEAQIKFARHHLDWLEDLAQMAKDRNIPELYQDLYCFCARFVKADTAFLHKKSTDTVLS